MLMLPYHSLRNKNFGTEAKQLLDRGFGGYVDGQGEEESTGVLITS